MRRDREKKDEERQRERDEKRQQQAGSYQQTSDITLQRSGMLASWPKVPRHPWFPHCLLFLPETLSDAFSSVSTFLPPTIFPLSLSHSLSKTGNWHHMDAKGTMAIRRGSILEIQFNSSGQICSIFSEEHKHLLQPHVYHLTRGQQCSKKGQCVARGPGSGPGVSQPLCLSVLEPRQWISTSFRGSAL